MDQLCALPIAHPAKAWCTGQDMVFTDAPRSLHTLRNNMLPASYVNQDFGLLLSKDVTVTNSSEQRRGKPTRSRLPQPGALIWCSFLQHHVGEDLGLGRQFPSYPDSSGK